MSNVSADDRAVIENLDLLMDMEIIESESDWEAIQSQADDGTISEGTSQESRVIKDNSRHTDPQDEVGP